MLIVKSRTGESIVIAKDIKITVLCIKSEEVKIGIDAPKAISIQQINDHLLEEVGSGTNSHSIQLNDVL